MKKEVIALLLEITNLRMLFTVIYPFALAENFSAVMKKAVLKMQGKDIKKL